jgi:hypothetical protein
MGARRVAGIAGALVFATTFVVAGGDTSKAAPRGRYVEWLEVALGGRQSSLPKTATEDEVRGFVRARLADDAFYPRVLPRLFDVLQPRWMAGTGFLPLMLKSAPFRGELCYFLEKPCRDGEVLRVGAWWNGGQPVWIAREAYANDASVRLPDGGVTYCDSKPAAVLAMLNAGPHCVCGPFLTNCAPSMEVQSTLTREVLEEPVNTVRYVIQSKLPFSSILTLEGSVRGSFADLFYARNELLSDRPFDMSRPDEHAAPALRSRPPQYGGGILTTPEVMFWDDAKRRVVAEIWEDLLCDPLHSNRAAESHVLLSLGGKSAEIRRDVRTDLATNPACLDCHVVLENGLKATAAASAAFNGMRYLDRDIRPGTFDLFVGTRDSPRTTGRANYAGLGAAIAAQPEFRECVVRKVTELVYAGHTIEPEVYRELVKRFAERQDFAQLFEDAVVHAWAAR